MIFGVFVTEITQSRAVACESCKAACAVQQGRRKTFFQGASVARFLIMSTKRTSKMGPGHLGDTLQPPQLQFFRPCVSGRAGHPGTTVN